MSDCIIVKRFRARPLEIDAVLVTEDNLEAVAAWCGGVVMPAPRCVSHNLWSANVGDWVVRDALGDVWCHSPEVIADQYEVIDDDPASGSPSSPRLSGATEGSTTDTEEVG